MRLAAPDRTDDGRHQNHDRDGADTHPVDLVHDRGQIDRVPASELSSAHQRMVAPRMCMLSRKSPRIA